LTKRAKVSYVENYIRLYRKMITINVEGTIVKLLC